jgi:hypothetical protein
MKINGSNLVAGKSAIGRLLFWNKALEMARLSGFIIPSQAPHVILQNNNRTEIFSEEAGFYPDKIAVGLQEAWLQHPRFGLMTSTCT